jgi:hypothetical protein
MYMMNAGGLPHPQSEKKYSRKIAIDIVKIAFLVGLLKGVTWVIHKYSS